MKLTREEAGALCAAQPRAYAFDWPFADLWAAGKTGKVFALWPSKGEQRGLHVRSNDVTLQADPRVTKSAIEAPSPSPIEVTNNFWFLSPTAEWSVDEVNAALAESVKLATRKDGGVKRGGEFNDLYLAVRKAMEATPPPLRPPRPHHAGGPAAKILGDEAAFARQLAAWAANRLAPFVPEADRAVHAEMMALLAEPNPEYSALYRYHYRPAGSPAVEAARFAIEARGKTLSAPSNATGAVLQVHAHMMANEPRPALTAFVSALDDTVLVGEFRAVATVHLGTPELVCERVLWRGADAKGNAGRWLVRIAPGRYALVHKVGRKWQLVEGERDEVLATVPDSDFEKAAVIAIARDVAGQTFALF